MTKDDKTLTTEKKLTKEEKQAIRRQALLSCLPVAVCVIGPLTFCLTFVVGSLINTGLECFTNDDLEETSFKHVVSSCAIPATVMSLICLTLSTTAVLTALVVEALFSCTMPKTVQITLTPADELIHALSSRFFKKKVPEENKQPLLLSDKSTELEEEGNPTSPAQQVTHYRIQ